MQEQNSATLAKHKPSTKKRKERIQIRKFKLKIVAGALHKSNRFDRFPAGCLANPVFYYTQNNSKQEKHRQAECFEVPTHLPWHLDALPSHPQNCSDCSAFPRAWPRFDAHFSLAFGSLPTLGGLTSLPPERSLLNSRATCVVAFAGAAVALR